MFEAPGVLGRIVAVKREEVAVGRRRMPEGALRAAAEERLRVDRPRGFASALQKRVEAGQPAVIAEAKRASPSKGILRDSFDPAAIAASYERGGACCVSVLTDERFFQGSNTALQEARAACSLPVLRKDFVIDAWQVYESAAIGADAVLLIAACLPEGVLSDLAALSGELGLDVLVEVHTAEELERVLRCCAAPLVGVNNRDLHSFEVRLETTLTLLPLVPKERLLVSESGISSREAVQRLWTAGVRAFLVGEALMRCADPGEEVQRLFGGLTAQ
ncbi:MAG: indole-3-glycerol phosphate synthase TrpC [Hydrogenophilus sp.]|nr:indole-3-glycerol phosphate synthase TrpC [Hydrogenophilus sp.]